MRGPLIFGVMLCLRRFWRGGSGRFWWFVSAIKWNTFFRAIHGNTEAVETVWSWNARRLFASRAESDDGSRSAQKWAWLHEALDEHGPTALFLIEVEGSLRELRVARKQLRAWGYASEYVVGTVKRKDNKGRPVFANCVFGAVRVVSATIVSHARRADRVIELVYKPRGTRAVRRVVCIHGLHSETDDSLYAAGSGFGEQIQGIAAAVSSKGGLVVGDMNYVGCRKWRSRPDGGTAELGPKDRLFKAFAGHSCACCSTGAIRAPVTGSLIAGQGWTRRVSRAEGWHFSKLDAGVGVGVEAERWTQQTPLWVTGHEASGMVIDLSDHALVRFVRVAAEEPVAILRDTPVRLGSIQSGGPAGGGLQVCHGAGSLDDASPCGR